MFAINARFALPARIAGGLIKPEMTRRQARTALKLAGWRHVGGGSYSSAWLSPDGKRVAKVSKPDRGSEAICEAYCRAKRNRALPKYFGRVVLSDGGHVYEVEALQSLDGDAYDHMMAVYRAETDPDHTYRGGGKVHLCEAREATIRAIRLLQSMVDKIGTDELDWDLHRGNAMMRGDVVVLIDPLYDPERITDAWKGTEGNSTDETSPQLTEA